MTDRNDRYNEYGDSSEYFNLPEDFEADPAGAVPGGAGVPVPGVSAV